MPAERIAARGTTPVGKQRVRTGCLTCRKRRRKCDEGKPRCENCEAKGFPCEYRINLAFVQSSASLGSNGPSNRALQTYSSIKFVIDDPATPSVPSTPKENHPEAHTPSSESRNDGRSGHDFAVDSRLDDDPAARQSSDPIAPFSFIHHPIPVYSYDGGGNEIDQLGPPLTISTHRQASILGHISTPVDSRAPTTSYFSSYLGDGPEAAIIHHETSLLRHYRYNMAPWIDVGDPESSFGIKVMLEAREDQSLFNAVLALAASHRSSVTSQIRSDLEDARTYAREAECSLPNSKGYIRLTVNILFMLRDFFLSSPHSWRDVLSHLVVSDTITTITNLTEHLNQPLFFLYFRIDLAAGITTSKAPLVPFLSFLRSDGSPITQYRSSSQPKSPRQTFDHALFLLASALSLVFGLQESPYPHAERSDGTSLGSSRRNLTSTGWTSLWNDCLGWYNNRPVELQQIVEIRGIEVDQVDLERTSSFPILIYTTPLALVSNSIFHITSLLLLTHKPRLLRTVAGPRSFASPMWHAQTIAGISTTNDFPEQWDPILVAGLILVAKGMTHGAQQTAVLERLLLVNATTGMNLDNEIEALRSSWSIAGYNDEMIS